MTTGDVLFTTVPEEAGGGVAAVHKVIAERQRQLKLRFFTVGSPAPFHEPLHARYLRLVRQYAGFARAIASDSKIDIVHINTAPDQRALQRDMVLIFLARIFMKKVVVQVHGRMADYPMSPVARKLAEKALSMSDRILVFSLLDKEKLEAATGNRQKVVTFPNAIKVSDFTTMKGDLRAMFAIPPERKVVLFLARLIKEKGVYDLLEAIPAIVASCGPVTFLVAGDGPEKALMMERVAQGNLQDSVVFTGNLGYENVIRAFQTADVMVLPSYSEGMPMSVLQALASGTSIVATPVGAIPDFLRDGENGFLVQPNSPDEIARKVLDLLDNDLLRERIGEANRQLAREQFDLDAVTVRLAEVYASL
jgi:glycosyltransferase involved in cell wall biosynthesis